MEGCGRIGKADARPDIFEVGAGAGSAASIYEGPRLTGGERVGGSGGKHRLCSDGLMTRRFDVPAESEIQSQIVPRLEIVLRVERIVVLGPAGVMRGHA